MSSRPIPDGYHAVIPYLVIAGASRAIDFYRAAFGAVEVVRHLGEGREIRHAEIRIGGSPVMLADENLEQRVRAPASYGGSPVSLMIYVEDVDDSFARALEAGAKVIRPVRDEDHGDRMGGVEDPFGYSWWLASRTR